MKILYWNVFVGHNPTDVHRQLLDMVHAHRPHLVGLGEARKESSAHIEIPGYVKYQLHVGSGGAGDEQADTAVYVRKDVKVKRHTVLRMTKRWHGPKHAIPHQPRVYHTFLLKTGGKTWKVGVGHWPFNTGRAETVHKVGNFIKHNFLHRPVLWVGDLNTKPPVAEALARSWGAKRAGEHVDQIIYKNCQVTAVGVLGKHGSDHDALLFHLHA